MSVNQLPQIDSHLTAKLYVDNAIDESSIVRNNKDNDFNNYNLTNINSITLNKQAENDNEVITKSYVDQFHQENERSRRDVGLDFYNESNDLVKNNQSNNFNNNIISNVKSIEINDKPSNDKHCINKKYFEDELDNNTIVRLNDNSNNGYLKVQINNNFYNLQIHNKIQITDVTQILFPNTGYDLLPKWRIVCNNRFNGSIPSDFIRSTVTNSPTNSSGATIIPPIGNAFMYLETSANNHNAFGDTVFVELSRTDIINISNITFYYNRFSSSDSVKRNMGRFEIQILRDNVWHPIYTIAKNTNYSTQSTDWIILNLNITQANQGIKLIYSAFNY